MKELLKIADKTENSARYTPQQVLENALKELGENEYTRALVILARHEVVTDGSEGVHLECFCGGVGVNNLELIGLAELGKNFLARDIERLDAKEKATDTPS